MIDVDDDVNGRGEDSNFVSLRSFPLRPHPAGLPWRSKGGLSRPGLSPSPVAWRRVWMRRVLNLSVFGNKGGNGVFPVIFLFFFIYIYIYKYE